MNSWVKIVVISTVSFSCGRPRSIPTPEPVPTFPQTEIQPVPATNAKHEWRLSLDQSPHSYRSTTRNTVKNTDQANAHERTTEIQSWFTFSINSLHSPVVISGSIDSARVTSEISETRFPIVFAGSLNINEFTLGPASQNTEHQCLSGFESLLAEVRPAINTIPLNLKTGATWSDSLQMATCSGEKIPTTAHITRQYKVQGSTDIGGRGVLAINRFDRTQLTGDGTQGQHQVHLQGEGTTTTSMLIDAATGILVRLESNQQLRVSIGTSGRTSGFLQSTHQLVDLVR